MVIIHFQEQKKPTNLLQQFIHLKKHNMKYIKIHQHN